MLPCVNLDKSVRMIIKTSIELMVNIADPDQTAPEEQSDLGLQCLR